MTGWIIPDHNDAKIILILTNEPEDLVTCSKKMKYETSLVLIEIIHM